MTNSEYFEKNKISFAKAMEIFNKQKDKGGYKSFDKFLVSERLEHKFKIGDIIVMQLNDETKGDGWKHNVVFEIMSFDKSDRYYEVKYLTPHECSTCSTYPHAIGATIYLSMFYVDRTCELY